ncbi:MAG: hypothetical protein WD489_03710 [Rhodovibrionaceae bacterium]
MSLDGWVRSLRRRFCCGFATPGAYEEGRIVPLGAADKEAEITEIKQKT